MKSRVRVGQDFRTPPRKPARAGVTGTDFSEAARSFTATFTDLFSFFEGAPVTMPEITTTNPERWSPLIIHFSWHRPDGEVDIALREKIVDYIDRMAGHASPGLTDVICDATDHNEGRMIFKRPEDAHALLVRVVEKHPLIKDVQAAPHTRAPTPGAPAQPKPTLLDVPARPYLSQASAFEQAAGAQTLTAHKDMYLINLERLANEIAQARGKSLPAPLAALH